MGRKKIFRLSKELLDILDGLEHVSHNDVTKINNFRDRFAQFQIAVEEIYEVSQSLQQLLQQLDVFARDLDKSFHSTALMEARNNIQQILEVLAINPPDMIFLLTAPFDEDARTGDGQYAKSLVEGFAQYASTQCIWLRHDDGHYTIPSIPGLQPIPEKTIPSVYVLQPVANERTVLSGYQCQDLERLAEARQRIEGKITLRTPQIILDSAGALLCVGFMSGTHKGLFGLDDVETRLASVSKQLTEFKQQHGEGNNEAEVENIIKKLEQYKTDIGTLLYSTKEKGAIVKVSIPEKTPSQLFKEMVEYSREHGVKVNASTSDFASLPKPLNAVNAVIKPWKDAKKDVKKLDDRRNELQQAYELLCSLREAFKAPRYNDKQLVSALEKLAGTQESFYDFVTMQVGKRPAIKPDAAEEFYKVLEIAEADEDRQNVTEQLAQSMLELGEDQELGLDIHIRAPDTGAFIMPEDITLFQNKGISVNITVHEYKQAYTRRYLQKMIHDLLRKADSVLFFNEKDKSNAVKAAQNGDLDNEHKERGLWPIESYNLKDKVGLTVASQVLSGVPLLPEQVIQKAPNILSFGTIRPGKGFEEVLIIARELKRKANAEAFNFPGIVLIAGDPQNTKLMEELFAERYGYDNFKKYQDELQESSMNYETMDSAQKRNYWQTAKQVLEERVTILHNRYLEIHPWCETKELELLKGRSKYVCRMDDMGMRNNGSAIISVLDVGVIYTKWGSVTDHDYYPHPVKKRDKGIYGDAVDLGVDKYGEHKSAKVWKEKAKVWSSYKREAMARNPATDILPSIIKREQDQQNYAQDLIQSQNYKTVVAAQKLLQEKFTLQNGVLNLQQAFVADSSELFTLEQTITEDLINEDRYAGVMELGEHALRQTFFGEQNMVRRAQQALAKQSADEQQETKVDETSGTSLVRFMNV